MLITKIGNNLKYWSVDHVIICRTLELLFDMAGGYSTLKLLLSLDWFLTRNHTEEHSLVLAFQKMLDIQAPSMLQLHGYCYLPLERKKWNCVRPNAARICFVLTSG
jgi:hypothetical protein